MNKKRFFRMLPKVDEVIEKDGIKKLLGEIKRELVIESIREEIDNIRNLILDEVTKEQEIERKLNCLEDNIIKHCKNKSKTRFRRVINATGTIIHTNLGRSIISKEIMDEMSKLATSYSNLEYDLEGGKRGSRYSHLEEIISRVTGAESCIVVNNNAAAVMLILSTMAKGGEVVVSRGELVEIGGSFRVPDVMSQSGATLVEVGTTNKTHKEDYERAVTEETKALMKIHTSNYRIVGFTDEVSLEEMVQVGKEKNIPVIEDIGSGVLIDLSKYGLTHEPTVQESIKAGIDIVSFSGDKLLGGPQAGIIVGKKKYIDQMKKNQLTRALRVDKFTISALELVFKEYINLEEATKKIPTLRMITEEVEEVEKRAKIVIEKIVEMKKDFKIEICNDFSQVGGGAMPLERIPTKVIKIAGINKSINEYESALRNLDMPVITRLYNNEMFLDFRTVQSYELEEIANQMLLAYKNIK